MKYIVLSILICVCLVSCDFDIDASPGAQMSVSAADAKKHGTFLYSYRANKNALYNAEIETVFAEKQYWLDPKPFSKNKIDNLTSQLVIVCKNDERDYDISWKISGFKSIHTLVIYKYYKGTTLPDTIPLQVVSINGKDTSKVIERDTLYKIR